MTICSIDCIYHRELEHPNKRLFCDMHGKEINKLPITITDDCEYYKTYENVKEKYFLSIDKI